MFSVEYDSSSTLSMDKTDRRMTYFKYEMIGVLLGYYIFLFWFVIKQKKKTRRYLKSSVFFVFQLRIYFNYYFLLNSHTARVVQNFCSQKKGLKFIPNKTQYLVI